MIKSVILCLLLYSLIAPSASSQDGGAIDDPVFYVLAANNIQYPVGAIRNSIYGRIFTSFEIDSAGIVRNVNVIYPLMDKKAGKILGFEAEIKAGLSKMPRLRTKDQGKYILPIAFAYTNVYHSTSTDYPTNRIPQEALPEGHQLLNEVQVTARSDRYRSLRNFSNIPPPSRQIVDF